MVVTSNQTRTINPKPCMEEDWEGYSIEFTTILSVYSFIGFVGNFIILIVYGRHRGKLSHSTHIYTLAIVDFVVCCVIIPYTIAFERRLVTSDIVCRGLEILRHILVNVSNLLLFAIAVERYVSVFHPWRRRTARKDRIIMMVVFLTGTVIGTPAVAVFTVTTKPASSNSHNSPTTNATTEVTPCAEHAYCQFSTALLGESWTLFYQSFLAAEFFVMMTIIIVLYIRVYRRIWARFQRRKKIVPGKSRPLHVTPKKTEEIVIPQNGRSLHLTPTKTEENGIPQNGRSLHLTPNKTEVIPGNGTLHLTPNKTEEKGIPQNGKFLYLTPKNSEEKVIPQNCRHLDIEPNKTQGEVIPQNGELRHISAKKTQEEVISMNGRHLDIPPKKTEGSVVPNNDQHPYIIPEKIEEKVIPHNGKSLRTTPKKAEQGKPQPTPDPRSPAVWKTSTSGHAPEMKQVDQPLSAEMAESEGTRKSEKDCNNWRNVPETGGDFEKGDGKPDNGFYQTSAKLGSMPFCINKDDSCADDADKIPSKEEKPAPNDTEQHTVKNTTTTFITPASPCIPATLNKTVTNANNNNKSNNDNDKVATVNDHISSSHRKETLARDNCKKAGTMLFICTLIYILTWLPFWIDIFRSTTNLLFRYTFLVGHVTNPLVYGVVNNRVRQEIKKLLLCQSP